MSKLALYVPLEAKPGKEKEVAEFLKIGAAAGGGRTGNRHLVRDPGRPFVICDIRYFQ